MQYTVAVDFDNTIYAGPFVAADVVSGDPLPGAIAWLKSELARGHLLIIHTCRLTSSHEGCTFPIESHRDPYVVRGVIASWLAQHGLTFARRGHDRLDQTGETNDLRGFGETLD